MYNKRIVATICGLGLAVHAHSSGESSPAISRQITLDPGMLSVETQGNSIGASLSVTYTDGLNPANIVMHGNRDWTMGGIEGSATIGFSIDGDGKPVNTAVIESSNEEIAEIALSAVQNSTFHADGGNTRHEVTYTAKLNKPTQPSAAVLAD